MFGACPIIGPDAPLIARMGGALSQVNTRIMLSPTFPVFGEADGLGASPRTALRTYNSWKGFVPGPTGQPGEKILVCGHVQARTEVISGSIAAADWPLFGSDPIGALAGQNSDTEGQSASINAKIAVRRTGQPGWVVINADSWVTMDPGEIEVRILGPGSNLWFGGPNPVAVDGDEGTEWQWVVVRVTACPVRCCYPPPGRSTWWHLSDPGAENEVNTFVRPRRATALRLGGSAPGGSGFVASYYEGTTTAARYLLTTQTVNGGFINAALDPWGAITTIEISGQQGPIPVVADWEIT